jgi:hypothetical protein
MHENTLNGTPDAKTEIEMTQENKWSKNADKKSWDKKPIHQYDFEGLFADFANYLDAYSKQYIKLFHHADISDRRVGEILHQVDKQLKHEFNKFEKRLNRIQQKTESRILQKKRGIVDSPGFLKQLAGAVRKPQAAFAQRSASEDAVEKYLKVLKMLENKTINVEEADTLIKTLEGN